MEIFMKNYIKDIQEKTSGMTRQEKTAYIWTYYWYHILGVLAMIALIFLFAFHYGFGNKKPVFTCVLVNQQAEISQTEEIAEEFAKEFDLPSNQVVISPDYTFSYRDIKLEGVNESSYEKFFFQWRNKELDAVILPESFYLYVKEMGGVFRKISETTVDGFTPYIDGDVCTGIVLGNDSFTEKITGKKDEKLLLAFPETGEHTKECEMFLSFLKGRYAKKGGTGFEKIYNG